MSVVVLNWSLNSTSIGEGFLAQAHATPSSDMNSAIGNDDSHNERIGGRGREVNDEILVQPSA
jgi:hypothetical protein